MTNTLEDLERRVTEKLSAAMPKWDVLDDPMDGLEWTPGGSSSAV